MFHHPLRRGLVGLVGALAVLVALAGPAAATPSTGSITDLDMVLDSAGAGPNVNFTVPVSTGAPCPADTSAPELDIEFNGGSGTTAVTGARIPFDFFQYSLLFGNHWYRTELALRAAGPNGGTISGSAPVYSMTQNLNLTLRLYRIGNVGGPYTCPVGTGTLVCTTNMPLSLSGTWTPTAPNTSMAPPGTADLSGSGVTGFGGACSAPFAGFFNGATVTVNDLSVTF